MSEARTATSEDERLIERFRQQFSAAHRKGEAHVDFACHVALPAMLSPDLAYKIWYAFREDVAGHPMHVPWIAVADLLLSPLCVPFGGDAYQMRHGVRAALIRRLRASPRFGDTRARELARFLFDVARHDVASDDPIVQSIARSQLVVAHAEQAPAAAARTLLEQMADIADDDHHQRLEMDALLGAVAGVRPELAPLVRLHEVIAARGSAQQIDLTPIVTEVREAGLAGLPKAVARTLLEPTLAPSAALRASDRASEQARLVEALGRRGARVLVCGPPRSGKTHLVQSAFASMKRDGIVVSLSAAGLTTDAFGRALLAALVAALPIPGWPIYSLEPADIDTRERWLRAALATKAERHLIVAIDDAGEEVFGGELVSAGPHREPKSWGGAAVLLEVASALGASIVVVTNLPPWDWRIDHLGRTLVITLERLGIPEIKVLASSAGLRWTEREISAIVALTSGIPSPTRLLIDACTRVSLSEALKLASEARAGFAGLHERLLLALERTPGAAHTWRALLRDTALPLDHRYIAQLWKLGLVVSSDRRPVPSCVLYRKWFPLEAAVDSRVPVHIAFRIEHIFNRATVRPRDLSALTLENTTAEDQGWDLLLDPGAYVLEIDGSEFPFSVEEEAVELDLHKTLPSFSGTWVLVAGSSGREPTTEEAARALGALLARCSYGLITGGAPGVDRAAVSCYADALEGYDEREALRRERLIQYYGRRVYGERALPPAPTLGQIFEVASGPDEYWEPLKRADAVVIIGGGEGTQEVARVAKLLGRPVVPFPGTGGAADALMSANGHRVEADEAPEVLALRALRQVIDSLVQRSRSISWVPQTTQAAARAFLHPRALERAEEIAGWLRDQVRRARDESRQSAAEHRASLMMLTSSISAFDRIIAYFALETAPDIELFDALVGALGRDFELATRDSEKRPFLCGLAALEATLRAGEPRREYVAQLDLFLREASTPFKDDSAIRRRIASCLEVLHRSEVPSTLAREARSAFAHLRSPGNLLLAVDPNGAGSKLLDRVHALFHAEEPDATVVRLSTQDMVRETTPTVEGELARRLGEALGMTLPAPPSRRAFDEWASTELGPRVKTVLVVLLDDADDALPPEILKKLAEALGPDYSVPTSRVRGALRAGKASVLVALRAQPDQIVRTLGFARTVVLSGSASEMPLIAVATDGREPGAREPKGDSGTVNLPTDRQRVLDLCASFQVQEGGAPPINHVLLSGDPKDEDALRGTVAALANEHYVEVTGLPGRELVHVTPGGILASSSSERCELLGKRLLAFLQNQLVVQGVKFTSYSWEDLKAARVVAGDDDFPAIATVIEVFELSRGGSRSGPPPKAEWYVPRFLVQLRGVRDLRELCLAMAFKGGGVNTVSSARASTRSEGESPTDFVILTGIELERRAVCTAFGLGNHNRIRKDSRVYWRGRLPLNAGGSYEVVVAQSADLANVDMALLTNDAIHDWRPQAALLVGIAATTDRGVRLGDVVIGADVYYYERGKQTPQGSKPEPKIISPDATLWNNVNALPEWDGNVPIERPDGATSVPTIHRGVIASGEKVIADAAAMEKIAAAHRKILAIEMEGFGFSRAVWNSFERVRHLVIRSICDDGTSSKNDSWHEYAAAAAAAYTRHLLCDGPLAPRAAAPSGGTGESPAGAVPARITSRQLTKDERRVLGVFADFGIGANEYLPDGSFQSRSDRFPPPLRDRAFDVLESMHMRGLLRRTQHGYVLTEEAARLLYDEE